MCGIFGIITSRSLPVEEMVERASCAMAHRGPDGKGLLHKDNVTLAHRRLSIIDLVSGAQPMQSPDATLQLTFNGEIYNFRELREELRSAGHIFSTHSDTEVLLHAYSEWGVDCLRRLRGMYAFALADHARGEVFLARDRFGIKPLMYRVDKDFFAFSSELPPLAALEYLPTPEVNPEAVALFFRYQYVPAPHTIYREIHKLRPGHAALVDMSGNVRRIWEHFSPKFAAEAMTPEEATEEADRVVRESVIAHSVADVPIGVFLSGGIDSTLVAMNLARSVSRSIPAFTIAFTEQEFSELQYATQAADHLGLTLHTSYVESVDLEKLPAILSHYGEPYGDSSVLPTWHVGQLARQHVPVVLSGDAGDELFAGYHSYAGWMALHGQNHLRAMIGAASRFKPRTTLHHLRSYINRPRPDVTCWHTFMQYFPPEEIEQLLAPELAPYSRSMAQGFLDMQGKESEYDLLDLVQTLDQRTYLPECMLPKVDVTSMSHSLEVRTPLLDYEVAKLAFRLPRECRYTPETGGKRVLKAVLKRYGFPDSFVNRRKQGFGIPVNHWFLPGGRARILLEELLCAHKDALSEYLNLAFVRRLMYSHSLQHDVSYRLWLCLAFSCWVHNRHGAATHSVLNIRLLKR